MATSCGRSSMLPSSEKMPTTKAWSESSSLSDSWASSSISRPRITAVWPMAGGGPPLRDAVSSMAAQRNSFLRPMSITAWRNEVISRCTPKPTELIRRIRLKARPASFLSTSSMASVLACWRTRFSSWTMLCCEGDSSLVRTTVGRANQKPWNSCMPRRPTCSCCWALSTFSAISSARVWRPAKLTSTANWSGASTDRSNLM